MKLGIKKETLAYVGYGLIGLALGAALWFWNRKTQGAQDASGTSTTQAVAESGLTASAVNPSYATANPASYLNPAPPAAPPPGTVPPNYNNPAVKPITVIVTQRAPLPGETLDINSAQVGTRG